MSRCNIGRYIQLVFENKIKTNYSKYSYIGRRSQRNIMFVEILFENDNYIIVNKPYDMHINSDDRNEKNTVACYIASCDSHLSTSTNPLHFVQRLDYATSGVLCIAKHRKAAADAGKLFERRQTKKYYLSIIRGHIENELCDINYRIGADPSKADSTRMMMVVRPETEDVSVKPRSAHTRLLLLETGFYENDPVSVVMLKPATGRRHQLRVHCSSIGHTILGDYTYSERVDRTPHRMFLHAIRLVLPLREKPLDVHTSEPFFTDFDFTTKWKSYRVYNEFKSKEEFMKSCDIIDKPDVPDVLKYKKYD